MQNSTRQRSLFPFDNTYARLPERFFARLPPTPVLREYIISEAMAALGIATTRSLAASTRQHFDEQPSQERYAAPPHPSSSCSICPRSRLPRAAVERIAECRENLSTCAE